MREVGPVTLGRRFGRDCLKFGKRAFIVLDNELLAFLTGDDSARLLQSVPDARFWNPNDQARPKQSWVACPACHADSIIVLASAAFGWVQSKRYVPASDGPMGDVGDSVAG